MHDAKWPAGTQINGPRRFIWAGIRRTEEKNPNAHCVQPVRDEKDGNERSC